MTTKTEITIEEVLRCWRKYSLWPMTQIRIRSGEMGEMISLAKPDGSITVRLDTHEMKILAREDVFPIWWPEEQWVKGGA